VATGSGGSGSSACTSLCSLSQDGPPRTVVFTETGEECTITGWCRICRVTADDFPIVVVSASGIAHHVNDWGMTGCGHEATGSSWWWPE
jgi:hypothetical protein